MSPRPAPPAWLVRWDAWATRHGAALAAVAVVAWFFLALDRLGSGHPVWAAVCAVGFVLAVADLIRQTDKGRA